MSTVYSGVDFVCIRRTRVKQEQSLLGDELLMSKRYPVTLTGQVRILIRAPTIRTPSYYDTHTCLSGCFNLIHKGSKYGTSVAVVELRFD